MNKLKFLIFTLTLLLLALEAKACTKGHFLTLDRKCEICPDGQYQPKENCLSCMACTACETDKGSFVVRMCTKETDTECKCREGFAPWGDDTSTCKCEPGFGLTDAQCSECENGYFNPNVNKPCRKWTECEYGVKINGTTTSDVICNPDITTPNTACSTSNCRQEGIQTQNRDTTTTTTISSSSSSSTTTTTTTTATPLGHTLTTKRLQPPMPSNTSNYTGLVLLLFGIGALIILTAVTCKMHITPCVRNPSLPSKDSMCRRPVEEIGDGSLSSLKLNTEP